MKYLILIESTYKTLPFGGFVPRHRGSQFNVWESHKEYSEGDAIHYIDRLVTKFPDSIYGITREEVK